MWYVVPLESDHYSVVDETESDLDTANYIWANYDSQMDMLTLHPDLPPCFIEAVEMSVNYKGAIGSDTSICLRIGDTPPWYCISGPLQSDIWVWETLRESSQRYFSAEDLADCHISLESGSGTRYVAAIYARLLVRLPVVSCAANCFAQRFRCFDDATDEDVSLERRDLPSGPWSTPTQPFSGDGNHSPDIECLPSGALRAAYIDSDGNLQKMVSLDDGESWGAA